MILNFLEDKNPDDEVFLNLKNKKIDQKFIYFDSGAAGYYANDLYTPPANEYINFARAQILGVNAQEGKSLPLPENKKTAFVSLGCGSCNEEIKILENLPGDITLFAVDSSASMLNLAEKTLEKSNFNHVLIQADFTTIAFREQLNNLLDGYNRIIFYFSGFTFCNFGQSAIDLINKLIKPGNVLMFYVVTIVKLYLYHNLFTQDARLTLKNKGKMTAYFEALKKFKVPRNSGKMIMGPTEEKELGSLCLNYYFQFGKRVKITHKGEFIEFLPGEKILIQTIRLYDFEKFVAYFKSLGFNLLDLDVSESVNVIYAFEKIT